MFGLFETEFSEAITLVLHGKQCVPGKESTKFLN